MNVTKHALSWSIILYAAEELYRVPPLLKYLQS
jgi:hypothetical protein